MYQPHPPITDAVLLAGVSGVLLGSALLLAGPNWRKRHGRRLFAILLAGLAGGASAASQLGQPSLALALAILAGLSAVGWLLRSRRWANALGKLSLLLGHHQAQSAVLVAAGFGVLLWYAGWAESQVPEWSERERRAALNPPPRKPGPPALTDRGRPIVFYPTTADTSPCCNLEYEERYIRKAGLSNRLIRTALPSMECNCHGWVFTGGKFTLDDDLVKLILADNGYARAARPREGDLVVYHSPDGSQIFHTGVVKVVGPDGLVLVESKWAMFGRFLHAPQDQAYSPHWTYYRSPRVGHLLRGLGGAPPSAEPTPRPDAGAGQNLT